MLTEITIGSLEYIASNLREPDRLEIMNLMPHDSPVMFAWQAHTMIRDHGRGRIAWHDGRPAACVSFIEYRPTVWQISLFGTNQFRSVAVECLRWIRDTAPELRDEFGGFRLQCDSRIGHDEAAKFLAALGATKEGPPMRHFGKDGSSYQRWVWLADEDTPLLRKKGKPNVLRSRDAENAEVPNAAECS